MKTELPDPEDREAIIAFAQTFNGYEHHGSFSACSKAAKTQSRDSIEAIRNELFFAYRTGNHVGDDSIIQVYKELLPHLQRFLETD